MFTPVILAGGSGSRLWPLSRQAFPKQFLDLGSEAQGSMFQRTLSRLDGLEHAAPLVVSNEQHRFLVAEQLRLAKRQCRRIILEPISRNTAPAIALAALEALHDGGDPLLLVLAADHYIPDTAAFQAAVQAAEHYAASGSLVTFGITPTRPETGFGYIQCGARNSRVQGETFIHGCTAVSRNGRLFVEQRNVHVPCFSLPKRARAVAP